MKVKVFKDLRTAAVYSSITRDEYEVVSKGAPNTLCVMGKQNGETVPIFKISIGPEGSISKYGVVFEGIADDGSLMTTFKIPRKCKTDDEIKEFVADAVLKSQLILEKLEETVKTEATRIIDAQNALKDTIVIG